MEPGTGLGILGTLIGSRELIVKLLGPTADYLGEGLKTWTQKRSENLGRIFNNAIQKTGEKLNIEGQVPPRVLKGILDEGSFCDDPLTAEYFGGILAASRSGISRDDRGKTFIELLTRLSAYQIRAHFVFYQVVKNLYNGKELHFTLGEDRNKAQTFIPMPILAGSMGIEGEEGKKFAGILDHVIYGLQKEKLIEENFVYGNLNTIQKFFKSATDNGVIFTPSYPGVELFLWGYGRSDLDVNNFLEMENSFKIPNEISIVEGSLPTTE